MSRDLVVGLCDPGNDPFWLQVKDAIYQTARRVGIQLVPIDSSVPGDAQGPAAQLAVVEELLALELHAVINWGWPEQLALPVLEAGLPIIHLSETAVSHPLAVSPFGLYDVACLAADHLAAHLGGAATSWSSAASASPACPTMAAAAWPASPLPWPAIRASTIRTPPALGTQPRAR